MLGCRIRMEDPMPESFAFRVDSRKLPSRVHGNALPLGAACNVSSVIDDWRGDGTLDLAAGSVFGRRNPMRLYNFEQIPCRPL
jgi:hypothetical protein